MLAWLGPEDPFPPAERALKTPNGLLAAGADLSLDRLLQAYRRGIFPWYSGDEPLLWWCPDPRMVLYTGELKVSRSTFYYWRQTGKAPRCIKLPNGDIRVRRTDLDAWLSTLEDAA